MKQLFYDLSPEAYRLASVLTDYSYEVGIYKKTLKKKWVLEPAILNTLLTEGYLISQKDVWGIWQDLLRQAAFVNQGGKSLLTGKNLDVTNLQLHHALVTKGTIQGLKGFDRHLIHHTYNTIVLSPEEHLDGQVGADNRCKCAEVLGGLYGLGLVKLWYFAFSAKLKCRLPNVF